MGIILPSSDFLDAYNSFNILFGFQFLAFSSFIAVGTNTLAQAISHTEFAIPVCEFNIEGTI
jgi:hypothetical protein